MCVRCFTQGIRQAYIRERNDRHKSAHGAKSLSQTAIAQPVLFAFQYALARLWMSWGVGPRAMLGHSLGQFVAATLADVWTLEDAPAMVAAPGGCCKTSGAAQCSR